MSNQPFMKSDAACRGFNWEQVFKKCLPELQLNTKHQPCPACGGKDRFRLFGDWPETGASICNQCDNCDGIGLLMKSLNLPFCSVMRMLDGEQIPAVVRPKVVVEATQADQAKRLRVLKQHLQQGKPLKNSQRNAATQYLHNRGLGVLIDRNDLPDNLYYIPNLQYRHPGEHTQRFGCMFGAVHDVETNLAGGHRIYLSADGNKAPVNAPKKSLPAAFEGAMHGAAVRLYPAKHSLCITEGIETALAVRCMRPSLPVWATLTAGGMRTLRLPAEICDVHIFADHDLSGAGAKAVYWLATRLRREGRQVTVYCPSDYLPANTYGDFLDVWCMGVTSYE
jgi:putative DNA primase/helicase